MRVHNLRLGFATNSSSSHSIVILDGKNVVKDCFVEGQEFGGQNFTATTSPSKMAWLGQVVRHSLRKYMPPKAAIFCAKHLVESDLEDDGYCDHQSCLLIPRQHGEMWPDERWIDDLRRVIGAPGVAILGEHDQDEDPHPLHAGARPILREVPKDCCDRMWVCRKEEKHWVLFDQESGSKIALSFDQDAGEYAKASAPELVDLKITDWCDRGCEYCYQSSSRDGKHADFGEVFRIVVALARLKVFEVAMGGGEPLSMPNFIEVLEHCRAKDIVPNFSTRRLDWLKDEKFAMRVLKSCGSWAYTIDAHSRGDVLDLAKAWEPYSSQYDRLADVMWRRPSIQVPMGTVTQEQFTEILTLAAKHHFKVTLLAFKRKGRGASAKVVHYGWWLSTVHTMEKSGKCPVISIDTMLAKESKDMLDRHGIPEFLYRTDDGTHSCYIDAVSGRMAPSSFADDGQFSDIHLSACDDDLAEEIRGRFQSQ